MIKGTLHIEFETKREVSDEELEAFKENLEDFKVMMTEEDELVKVTSYSCDVDYGDMA